MEPTGLRLSIKGGGLKVARRKTLALAASLMLAIGSLPTEAVAQAFETQLQEKAQAQEGASLQGTQIADGLDAAPGDAALETRASEVAAQFSSDDGLAELWDKLAAIPITNSDLNVDVAALAALDGEPSTACGVVRAFVEVASAMEFDAVESVGADGKAIVRVSIDGVPYDLDIAAGNVGERPWECASEVSGTSPVDVTSPDDPTFLEVPASTDDITSSGIADGPRDGEYVASGPEGSEQAERKEAEYGEEGRTKVAKDQPLNGNEVISPVEVNTDTVEEVEASEVSEASVASASKAKTMANANAREQTNAKKAAPVSTETKKAKSSAKNSSKAGNNAVKSGATAKGSKSGKGVSAQPSGIQAQAAPSVQYYVHRQTYGWEKAWSKSNGASSGTTGQSKRLEGIKIRLAGSGRPSGSIQYKTHVQTYGWQKWVSNGAMSGTTGQSKRLEAIQIKLTGNMAKKYDVWYRVHAQTFGWMGWAKNGAPAGTAGYSKRLEAIQIRLVAKGGKAPGSTANAFKKYTGPALPQSYVGSYHERYYLKTGRSSYAGYIPAGQLYSERAVYIDSINGDKVRFRITYVGANHAAGENTTGWITSTVKNNRTDFDYSTDLYGGERGKGYIKFHDGKVTFKLTSSYVAPGRGRQALTTESELTFSKGSYDAWI